MDFAASCRLVILGPIGPHLFHLVEGAAFDVFSWEAKERFHRGLKVKARARFFLAVVANYFVALRPSFGVVRWQSRLSLLYDFAERFNGLRLLFVFDELVDI